MMSRGAKDDDASTLEEAANEAYEAGEEEFGAGTSPEAGRHLKPHLPILMHPLSQSASTGWQKSSSAKSQKIFKKNSEEERFSPLISCKGFQTQLGAS